MLQVAEPRICKRAKQYVKNFSTIENSYDENI